MGTLLNDTVQAGADGILLGIRWMLRVPVAILRRLTGGGPDMPTSSLRI